jgi:hypothetical protein
MNGLVKSVRHVQLKKIAFTPKLFQAIITYESHPSHPCEHDESDDIEHQKKLMNSLIRRNWFVNIPIGKTLPLGEKQADVISSLSWTSESNFR